MSKDFLSDVNFQGAVKINGGQGSDGQVLTSTGSGVAWEDSAGGASISISDTAPGSPSAGDLWYESDIGKTFVYYADGSSNQWVEIGSASAAAAGATGQVQYASSGAFTSSANFTFDGSDTVLKATLTVGVDDTGHDVKFFGATSGHYMEWDQSADTLNVVGKIIETDNLPSLAIADTGDHYAQDDLQCEIHLAGRYHSGTADPFADAYSDAKIQLFKDNSDGTGGSALSFLTSATGGGGLTRKLTINKDGNVGIGTTTPEHPLEVSSSANDDEAIRITNANESATGEVFLGFSPRAASADSTNPQAAISAIEYDSADHRAHLVFYTNGSNTDSAPTERMRINSGGKTLLGKFYTFDTVSYMPLQVHYGIATRSETSGGSSQMSFFNPNGRVGFISTSGTSTTFSTSSDYRLKENVVEMSGAVDRVNALRPVRFNWIADSDNTIFDGFLAHEVSSVVPEAITGEKDAMRTVAATEAVEASFDGDGNEISPAVDAQPEREEIDAQGIDQSKLVPLLVGAVQELTARLETLESA